MRKLFTISLLLVFIGLSGQAPPIYMKLNGKYLRFNGATFSYVEVSTSEIPDPPEPPSEIDTTNMEIFWIADFENVGTGALDLAKAEVAFPEGLMAGEWASGIDNWSANPYVNDQTLTIVDSSGNQMIQCFYAQDEWGIISHDADTDGSGHNVNPNILGNRTEVIASVNIFFPNSMYFPISGKLGIGLQAGKAPASCIPYNTSLHNGFGLSTAFWHDPVKLNYYLYFVDNDETNYCGDLLSWMDPATSRSTVLNPLANKNTWHNLAIRAVMNTQYSYPGSNGFIEVYWDGKLSQTWKYIRLRMNAGIFIDRVHIYWNNGGGDDSFAPDHDLYYYLDDMVVYKYEEGSGLPTGFTRWEQYDEDAALPLCNWDSTTNQPIHLDVSTE